MNETFQKELRELINTYSLENWSGTPDYILARYVGLCLQAFSEAVNARDRLGKNCPVCDCKMTVEPGYICPGCGHEE